MVTVIKYGNVNECECNTCKSTLRYHKNDVKYDLGYKYYGKYVLSYIECPVCGHTVEISEKR